MMAVVCEKKEKERRLDHHDTSDSYKKSLSTAS
ncbi:hypothetical protein AJ85_19090 [Alkalihalobacillus alcalophilus ATCC 27647 = CGMCC 1.3604]|uniref:Uncharacterized protein n=1 Tax=Alkalihalobacillus alcalophilus ATCC 27647 = CGMCC 1.3604 TaxID=1218173 RepID=A0A4S4JXW9_ALKAL|nr:hypothetical protein AJ85_19090 [Alkalihalobacillus alcalophilus ATCC 27647 = CGMCC 1.3604]